MIVDAFSEEICTYKFLLIITVHYSKLLTILTIILISKDISELKDFTSPDSSCDTESRQHATIVMGSNISQRLKMPTNVADTAQIAGTESHDREQLVKAVRTIAVIDRSWLTILPSRNCSGKRRRWGT